MKQIFGLIEEIMETILIAGYSGFIGKNLNSYFIGKQFQIRNLSLRNEKCIVENEVNVIVNLVGKAHDHSGKGTEADFLYANFELTKKIFQLFIESKSTLFIHISSIAAVEEHSFEGILDENQLPNPISHYGTSKRKAEEYLINYELPLHKKIVILRPTMVHGSGDKGNLSLLFKIVNKGIPYPLGNFKNERSFTSIDNLNFIIEKIIENKETISSGIYNFADDQTMSTEEIIRTIGYISERKSKILNIPKSTILLISKIGDVLKLPLNSKRLSKMTSNLVVSNQKIKDALQIKNLPVSAKEGLEKTIKSFIK